MHDSAQLTSILDRFTKAKVLVLGDVMLDRFVAGNVDRISPEAPIPVLHIQNETAMLGGAGNVARNVASLSGAVNFLSVVGDDGAGFDVLKLLADLKTAQADVLKDPARPTTIKTRFTSGTQQLLRTDVEIQGPLSVATKSDLLATIQKSIQGAGALALSDYGKGVLDGDVIQAAIQAAHDAGVPVIVDPKGRDYSRYQGADLVTPNKKELAEASAMATETDEDVIAASRHIMETCKIKAVLATRSADGMTLVMEGQEPVHLRAKAREVFDVSGAGDTVVAVMTLSLAAGAEASDAAHLANTAAGIVVAKSGTASVSPDELVQALHHEDLGHAEAKVLGLDAAASQVERWRAKGLKVGFTNGCFDLLHPGHIALLSQARAACDRLVVGLNSDSSIKRLKGNDRPIQPEAARAAVLGAVGAVDAVVLFSDDTPLELIKTLKPDVLVKGADYTVETVVGADIVQAYGGRVMLADLLDGHSTTSTVKRLKGD